VAAVMWAARGVGWVRLFGRQEINLSPRSRPLEACEQQLVPDTIAEVIAPPGGQIKFPREQLPMMTAIRPSVIIGNAHLLHSIVHKVNLSLKVSTNFLLQIDS
jgi:hypothetical protein